MMKIKDLLKNTEYQIDGPKQVKDILKIIGIIEGNVLVIRKGELLTKDVVVNDGDIIEILPVVSGG